MVYTFVKPKFNDMVYEYIEISFRIWTKTNKEYWEFSIIVIKIHLKCYENIDIG